MELWEKLLKKRIVSNMMMAAVGTLNYVLVTFVILLSLQAKMPAVTYLFLGFYVIILLAATLRVYKLINACRIDMNRGTTNSEFCEIISIVRSRLVVKVKNEEMVLYLPKMFQKDAKMVQGRKLHITFLQRSKTVIKFK
ncbi:MAG: hypothetical protein K0R15_2476 [Clostridiales bacterium]|jgi:hypothetical protein|nr:hypothetical protein [Clostridiales bacterium]